MKKTVLSSLVLSGAVFVMAPQAWAQTGGPSGSGAAGSGKSGSDTQMQRPTDPPMGGQQRSTPGSSSDLQSERSGARGGMATAGQQLPKEKVKQIQEALKEKGQDPGQADGIMGPKTQQALRAFQKSENLQVTGRVDEKTASALGVDVAGTGGAASGSATGAKESPSGKASSSQGAGTGAGGGASPAGKTKSEEGNPK